MLYRFIARQYIQRALTDNHAQTLHKCVRTDASGTWLHMFNCNSFFFGF